MKIGNSIDEFDKSYPNTKITKDDDKYWSLEPHSAFYSIVYYFGKDKKVSHIALFTDGKKVGPTFLARKLMETLGQPTANPKEHVYLWKVPAPVQVSVFLRSHYQSGETLILMADGFRPPWFPDVPPPAPPGKHDSASKRPR